MINVVLWLGKTKHSDDLAIIFARNNINKYNPEKKLVYGKILRKMMRR